MRGDQVSAHRQWAASLAVLFGLAGLISVVYRDAFRIGVFSDGWGLLEIGSTGFLKAPTVLLSYHTIPVTNLLSALLWWLFGMHRLAYQAVNLGEFALISWLLYELGVEILEDRRAALTAAFLFVMNAGFHEVTDWPVVGNFQSLAAALYFGAIFAARRTVDGDRRWLWSAVFAAYALAAFFTYEPTVSVLVVGPLAAWLVPRRREGRRGLSPIRTLSPLAFGVAIVGLVVVLSKLWTSKTGHQAAFLPTDFESLKEHAFYALRAAASAFSLRASDGAMVRIMALGQPRFYASIGRALVPALAMTLAAAVAIWRSRSPRAVFLGAWLATHLVIVGIATLLVSRMFYLVALPAALLSALVLWRTAERLTRAVPIPALSGGARRALPVVLVAGACAALAWGAAPDRRTAIELHLASSDANQHLLDVTERHLADNPNQPLPAPLLVNFPTAITERGITSMPFVFGANAMLRRITKRLWNYRNLHTYARGADDFAGGNARLIQLAELFELVRDPRQSVLLWQTDLRDFRRMSSGASVAPAEYSPANSPYLLWQDLPEGKALPLYPDIALDLPFTTPVAGSFVAIKIWQKRGTGFGVVDDSECTKLLPSVEDGWTTTAFPARAPTTTLTLRPDASAFLAGAWAFAPPEEWTPATAPFLPWTPDRQAFEVRGVTELPVAVDEDEAIRFEYLDRPGSELTVALNGVATTLAPTASAEGWHAVAIPVARGVARVRITALGTQAVLVRNVRAELPR